MTNHAAAGIDANWDGSPLELMKTSRVSSHEPRSIKYLDAPRWVRLTRREGAHVQEGAEDDDDHQHKESEREESVLRTAEGEVHDLDGKQEGVVVPKWAEDAEQAKRAQYGEAEEGRLVSRTQTHEEGSDKISEEQR